MTPMFVHPMASFMAVWRSDTTGSPRVNVSAGARLIMAAICPRTFPRPDGRSQRQLLPAQRSFARRKRS